MPFYLTLILLFESFSDQLLHSFFTLKNVLFWSCWVFAAAHRLWQLQLSGYRAQAQEFWCTGLAAPHHVGSSRTRDQTQVSCIGRQILNRWVTREVPCSILFKWLHSIPRSAFGLISSLSDSQIYFFKYSKIANLC